jgi:hypothetical protein
VNPANTWRPLRSWRLYASWAAVDAGKTTESWCDYGLYEDERDVPRHELIHSYPVPPFVVFGEAPDDYGMVFTLDVASGLLHHHTGNLPENSCIGTTLDFLAEYGQQGRVASSWVAGKAS